MRRALPIDAQLVEKLVAEQFPQWAALEVHETRDQGTSNAMFRLGPELVVRLPRGTWSSGDPIAEQRWLPQLAPYLPVAIPRIMGAGAPTHDYPQHWSILTWLNGTNPHGTNPPNASDDLARDLADFVTAFRRIDLPGAPVAHRGGSLADQDDATRAAIAQLGDEIDVDAAEKVWEAGLHQPEPERTWVHADLMPGNLLVDADGRLSGVLDFATAGRGDPACDLIVAWNLLPAPARDVFREVLDVDDATWARGRARALAIALSALPYYRDTNPLFAANAAHTIRESTQ